MVTENQLEYCIGCRDERRGIIALEEIKKKSKNLHTDLLLVDMSSQTSIKHAVKTFTSKYTVLDILIHNAADFDISRKSPHYSEDTIETVWATNHLGPVLLTELLMDALRKSIQARIITVASQGLMMHPFLQVRTHDPEFREGSYSVEKAYYQSKLAQLMYTYWLAEKLKETKITVNCIRVTNVQIDISRYPNLPNFMKYMYAIKSKFSITPEEMAKTYTYIATSPEMEHITGAYVNEKNQRVSSSAYSKDQQAIDAVMTKTMKYLTRFE